MRIGIDLGGTKTEIIVLDASGTETYRLREPTPRGNYEETLAHLQSLVQRAESAVATKCSVGIGLPGAASPQTGRIKNANSTWLNGQTLRTDLSERLQQSVRTANDANCLAVSEAVDGAAAAERVVFAAILGTGCGAGLAIDRQEHAGPNAVAGEWGHNSLPWPRAEDALGEDCYCGKRGCIEQYVSGTGLARDFLVHSGESRDAKSIVSSAADGDGDGGACAALVRYEDRLARSLAHVINLLDPDVIVLGGGMSNVHRIYENVPKILPRYVFGSECATPVVPASHGDSSGVRGAAWLWPKP